MESLLQAPSPAVITVYGPDGAAIVSPVRFRVHDGWFDDGARTRLAIASRYLGADDGRAHADLARRPPGMVVRLPLDGARAWDISAAIGPLKLPSRAR